jgi:16S rRNA (cytidine1402-2'-O)-methyltransferase
LGTLYIVATPIGNLEDITYRAVRVLGESDFIYAEDTRLSGILLKHYGIKVPMRSCNARNESGRIDEIKQHLNAGSIISIISDAGTPGISDPSVRIVSALRTENYNIVPLPGPSACITALSAAGLPTNSFFFAGFLPNKKGRQTAFKKLNEQSGTIILYESPYRIEKCLNEIQEFMGNRYVVIARELTKKFEEFVSGNIEDLIKNIETLKIKGEFVVLIAEQSFVKK